MSSELEMTLANSDPSASISPDWCFPSQQPKLIVWFYSWEGFFLFFFFPFFLFTCQWTKEAHKEESRTGWSVQIVASLTGEGERVETFSSVSTAIRTLVGESHVARAVYEHFEIWKEQLLINLIQCIRVQWLQSSLPIVLRPDCLLRLEDQKSQGMNSLMQHWLLVFNSGVLMGFAVEIRRPI